MNLEKTILTALESSDEIHLKLSRFEISHAVSDALMLARAQGYDSIAYKCADFSEVTAYLRGGSRVWKVVLEPDPERDDSDIFAASRLLCLHGCW